MSVSASKQLGFYLNQERCNGCLTCQIACKDKNDLDIGQLYRKVSEISGGGFTEFNQVVKNNVFAYWISLACNHCQEPLCVENCPSGAMQKREEDGIVFIDIDKCIGCRYCVWSCPYDAPQFNPEIGKVGKCDFCMDLLAQGEQPACVVACPMRALDFGTMEELEKKHGGTREIKGLPKPDITKPSLLINPHRDSALAK